MLLATRSLLVVSRCRCSPLVTCYSLYSSCHVCNNYSKLVSRYSLLASLLLKLFSRWRCSPLVTRFLSYSTRHVSNTYSLPLTRYSWFVLTRYSSLILFYLSLCFLYEIPHNVCYVSFILLLLCLQYVMLFINFTFISLINATNAWATPDSTARYQFTCNNN